jgi:pimeloyl-ACP methyl ester carboxylesterase
MSLLLTIPGYGFSGMPDRKEFAYTFENMTNIVEQLVAKAGASAKYSLYVMDYGAPIGYRLALRHPRKYHGDSSCRTATHTTKASSSSGIRSRSIGEDASAENRAALNFLVARPMQRSGNIRMA